MFRFDFILETYTKLNNLVKITGIVFVFTLLIGSGIHILEPHAFPTVFDGLWWALVTISTVGYGDFVPTSVLGRLLGVFLIILGVTLFSFFITNLASSTVLTAQDREKGTVSYYKNGHYLIVGYNERSRQLINQLQKLFPSREIILIDETLRSKPSDTRKVIFVKGSPTMDETFERANAKEAHTVIITANLHVDEKTADANTVLTLLTVKGINPDIYAIVEMTTPRQLKNAERAGANEIIKSSNHLSSLMINGVLFPGMTDVISHMLNHAKEDLLFFQPLPIHLVNENFNTAISELQTIDCFLMGIRRNDQTILAPAKDLLLIEKDILIFFKRA